MAGRYIRALCRAGAILGLASGTAGAAGFEGVGALGGSGESRAHGVSPDGAVVVGESNLEAFRWEGGVLTGLGFLSDEFGTGTASAARAASSGGASIVGSAEAAASGLALPVTWQGGPAAYAGVGIGWGSLEDVSHDGDVAVGTEWDPFPPVWPHAFQVTEGTSSGLGDPSFCDPDPSFAANRALGVSGDGNVIVGSQGCWPSGFPFPGEYLGFFAAGSFQSTGSFQGHAASGGGTVLVGVQGSHAARWETGSATSLGTLPGGNDSSLALDVSDDGAVVVGVATTGDLDVAFVWTAEQGMQQVADVLASLGAPATGWTLTQATGISADGLVVVGHGTNPDGDPEGWVASLAPTPVPALAPAGRLLALASLLSLGSTRAARSTRERTSGSASAALCGVELVAQRRPAALCAVNAATWLLSGALAWLGDRCGVL